MLALKLSLNRSAVPERKDHAALLNEESRLELQEAQLEAHLHELARREELTVRGLEDRRVQMTALVRQGAGLDPERLEELPRRLVHQEKDCRERERSFAARRAAIGARRTALEVEKREAEAREAVLTAAEQALVEIDRDLERERSVLLTRAQDERRVEVMRQVPAMKRLPPATGPVGAERRQHRRTALQTHVDLSSDSNFYSGFSSDLSDGGIFVATCCALPPGAPVDLLFTLPSGPSISARGVVRWSREFNEATPEIFPGLGVEFVEMSDEHRRAIREFTSLRDPLFWCE
jgi:uncharacterized protein (TIGR02266 family)